MKLWKRELHRLATEIGIEIKMHHLPPDTSKWNKIEHRLFSFIGQNWRATPLVSYHVIVDLIGIPFWDYLGGGLKVAGHAAIDALDQYIRQRTRYA